MKILHIVLNLKFGGLEKLTIDLADRLNARSVQSIICCLEDGGELISEAKFRGIEVISLGKKPGLNLSLPFKIRRLAKEQNILVIHCHNHGAMFYGVLTGILARIPVVTTIHGREKKVSNHPFWSLLWFLNKKIIFISQDAQKQFLTYARYASEKTKVIYNGIDLSRFVFDKSGRKMQELAVQDVGTISRLAKEKDQKTLIDVLSILRQKRQDVNLIFVGDGPMKDELDAYSRQLGVSEYVQYLGFQKDVRPMLKDFDLFVLSSLTEGVSISLLEAMATGLPVVATNVGGNPEVVVDGVTGFLVPPKDPQAMADAVMKILQNLALAQRMGEAGRRRVEEKFSLERMVSEYKKLYVECVNRGQGLGCRE